MNRFRHSNETKRDNGNIPPPPNRYYYGSIEYDD